MINREDSALIARERQNRNPAGTTGGTAKVGQSKSAAPQSRGKPPMRAGKSTPEN